MRRLQLANVAVLAVNLGLMTFNIWNVRATQQNLDAAAKTREEAKALLWNEVWSICQKAGPDATDIELRGKDGKPYRFDCPSKGQPL
jgi:hypothetical protein